MDHEPAPFGPGTKRVAGRPGRRRTPPPHDALDIFPILRMLIPPPQKASS